VVVVVLTVGLRSYLVCRPRLCDATWLDIKEGGMNEHNPFGWGHLINHSDVPNVMYVHLR
jgi:hypothetical protein